MPIKNIERLVVVTNPHSTGARRVEQEVLEPLRQSGASFVQHETDSPHTQDNIDAMRTVFRDGDTIVIAGGDGTKMQAINAALASQLHDTSFAMLGYGNYNDLAEKSLCIEDIVAGQTQSRTIHPLSIEVNGIHERWAPSYATLGVTARLAAGFSDEAIRQHLTGKGALVRKLGNLAELGKGYFGHRHHKLPAFHTSKSPLVRSAVTDILLLNSKKAGGIIRSAEDYGAGTFFGYREADVSTITKNLPFGLASLAGHMPADRVSEIRIWFEQAARIPFQSEGEFKWLDDVHELFVYKNPDAAIHLLEQANFER